MASHSASSSIHKNEVKDLKEMHASRAHSITLEAAHMLHGELGLVQACPLHRQPKADKHACRGAVALKIP